jgi:hypothetical protein
MYKSSIWTHLDASQQLQTLHLDTLLQTLDFDTLTRYSTRTNPAI